MASPLSRRALAALTLLALFPLPAAASSGRDYLPGAVLRGGWPTGRSGEVEQLAALHFSSVLELDAVARVADELFLVHRPARFETFHSLGSGVNAMAVLPAGGGLDAVLISHAGGLSVLTWTGLAPTYFAQVTVSGSAAWSGVQRLWVIEEAGTYVVCGDDPVAGTLRRYVHNPAVGPPTQVAAPASWSAAPATTLPAPLKRLVALEYASTYAGNELAWLFDASLFVTDASESSMVLSGTTTGDDQLGQLPASSGELLLWTTSIGAVEQLFAANGSAMSGPPPLGYTDRRFSGLLTLELSASSPGGGLELALPEDDLALITVLERDPGQVTNPFGHVWGLGDTLDSLEPLHGLPQRPGVRAACAGDFDRDGDTDLLVAHENTARLRFWMNQEVGDEYHRLYSEDVVTVTPRSGPATGFNVVLPMKRNAGANYTDFHVQVWLDASYLDKQNDPVLHTDELIPATGTTVRYDFDYDPAALSLASDHVCWVSFTGVTLNAGAIVERHPSRLVYYSPSAVTEGKLNLEHYPVVDHLLGGSDSGDTSGFRRGTRTSIQAGLGY